MLRKKRQSDKLVLSSTVALVVFVICYINSSTGSLEHIRRILCLEGGNDAPSPVIIAQGDEKLSQNDILQRMNPPPIKGRRPVPSHIEMCRAFLTRRAVQMAGGELEGHIHIVEDEAVCTDWSTPLAGLMQIFSGEVINQVSQKYGVTYSHECQRTAVASTGDGLNWKTIQQDFPASGLVLDDGSVNEDEIVELCKGCVSGFNDEEATASVDANHPNPSWFNPHSTRHCIMYPGTSRPLVNDQNELDGAAVQEQRMRAQQAPLGKLYNTVQDRMKLAAAKRKMESGPSFRLSSGRSVEDEEEEDGVIIYIDEGSMPMTMLEIEKHIPTATKAISIIISTLCVEAVWENDQNCIDFAKWIEDELKKTYHTAEISFEVITSTSTLTSRMVRAKVVICPPGTTSCLLPAMAKEEDTHAVVAESMGRSNTEEFFDFVSMPRGVGLSIANLDTSRPVEADMGRNSDLSSNELALGLEAFTSAGSGKAGYVDGCVEVRGRIGDWEQDYIYEDLATEKNGLLRGSSGEDVMPMEANQRSRGIVDGDKGNLQLDGKLRAWSDAHPECELDMLNVHGLCEVVHSMKLGVVQFVGDEYTEKMVRSFWALLGIDDGDVGEVFDGTSTNPKKYRKTVHCPKEKYSFDIQFTPNEKLMDIGHDAQPIGQATHHRYVPVPAPVTVPHHQTVPRTVYQGPGIGYSTSYDVAGVGGPGMGMGYAAPGMGMDYASMGGSCWGNPYGTGCGCNNAGTVRAAVPPPPPPMPQFDTGCHCVPFQQQYQYNYATAAQAAQQAPRFSQDVQPAQYQPLSGRQVIVGNVTPNQSYDQFVQNVDQFGRTVTNSIDQNDIVVLRTNAIVPQAYGGSVRRTQKTDAMTQDELEDANTYLHRAVEEYRRRTRQGDLLSYDPAKSKMPYVHVLDVAHMTHTHPLADGVNNGRRKVEEVPNLFDHWNHLLYTNLRDIAKAELKRNSDEVRAKQQGAPPGSPYENDVPLFPIN